MPNLKLPALATALLLAAACQTMTAAEPVNGLVGAWRLERYVDTAERGAPVYAFGEHPIGQFVFTADGHASISIMRNPPVAGAVADPDPDACVPDWYCSYFGTYTVDWQAHRWTIHVAGANIPSFAGTDQSRSFALSGDTLTISDSYSDGARTIHAERILVRER